MFCTQTFVDEYLQMVHACSTRDSKIVVATSTRLGFLTGDESQVRL
jgi:hypothetical protein